MTKSKNLIPIFTSIIFMTTSINASAFRAWDFYNQPNGVVSNFESNFQILSSQGSIPDQLWSDTYWPSQEGGAAWRWQFGKAKDSKGIPTNPHFYKLNSPQKLSRMTDEQINQLSPAEKYDIATGRFDYPTVRKEMNRTHPGKEKWAGLCHAVAIVTSFYKEPQNTPVLAKLPDGTQRTIQFYSSDIKALLALAADRGGYYPTPSSGARCRSSNSNSAECWDMNPATFYIVTTNVVGILKSPLLLDVDPGPEVWNSVIKSYSSVLTRKQGISPNAAPGTAREVRVDMTVKHTIGAQPAKKAIGATFSSSVYSFTLELDAYDNIIGGEWISKLRPDFVWTANPDAPSDPSLSFIFNLVENR